MYLPPPEKLFREVVEPQCGTTPSHGFLRSSRSHTSQTAARMGRYAKPRWAWFLDNKDVERMTHKQLQSACKKGRLDARGSSDALRTSLRGFLARKVAPDWYVAGMEHGLSASAAALVARTVTLPVEAGAVSLSVGQRLVHVSSEGKCSGERASLGSVEPDGCVTEAQRQSQPYLSRSKNTAVFEARAPGTAIVTLSKMRGAAGGWQHFSEVRVTVT